MAAVKQTVDQSRRWKAYKHGFVTDIDQDFAPKGLNADIVRFISAKKNEPEWMLEWRLAAFERWLAMDEPDLGAGPLSPIDYQDVYYYAAPKPEAGPKSLDEVDPELLETYAKLGIPLREQEVLAGVEGAPKYAVDAVFDSVSVVTTFKAELAEAGVIFCSMSRGDARASGSGAQVPGLGGAGSDNYFACLNSGGLLRRLASSMCRRACVARWSCRPISASMPQKPASSSAP